MSRQNSAHDLPYWVKTFLGAEIPVLDSTSHAIERLREIEDDVNPGTLANVIDADPLMTMKVLAYVSSKRKTENSTQTETVITSLIMLGVPPFFRHFGRQPTIEQHLFDKPDALAALHALIKRANRAAHFATGFAVHRGDTDVAVIRQAAFLNDFAEMLMFFHAPDLLMEIRVRQKADPTLRSAHLQELILGVDLSDLRQELMTHWHLSELIVRISDGKHPDHPAVRNVLLASRLARHTENGWDNPALPDDIDEISHLLNATPRVTRGFVYKIDQTS
jgi:HD-like signal output (HDOD) protein